VAINFEGDYYFGTWESPVFPAPELQTVRSKFAGVRGESEIMLESGGRTIQIHGKIHNRFADPQSLNAFLDHLDDQVGQHGTLEIVNQGPNAWSAGGVPRTFRHCTFEGFAKDAGPSGGALADNIGLLDGGKPSWWIEGTLTWRQLSTAT
jgi:hypothetical protein